MMNDLSSLPNTTVDMNDFSSSFYIDGTRFATNFIESSTEQESKLVNFPYVAFRQPKPKKKIAPKPISNAKRIRSNQKEQKRNMAINTAFQRLQQTIPHVPVDYRLPRVKTLRLAMNYIQHLSNTLNASSPPIPSSSSTTTTTIVDGPSSPSTVYQTSVQFGNFHSTTTTVRFNDFSQIVENELQTKNTYSERAEELMMMVRNKSV